MTAPSDLAARYFRQLAAPDALTRRTALRQLQRLQPKPARAARPSRYPASALRGLLEAAGNVVTERRNGTWVAGHEPAHGSRSGNCLVIWPDEGRWWCSSCRASGNAAALCASLRGMTYPQAAAYIAHHYGVRW